MKKVYRIYPGIGIGRLGNSKDSFFLSPEVPNLGPIELTNDDSIKPVVQFKDEKHRIRRQGARFRVFELQMDDNGVISQYREITSDEAEIEWKVQLANKKAAAGKFIREDLPESHILRNPPTDKLPPFKPEDLIISPEFPNIVGKDKVVKAKVEGKFKNREVYIGELRTDNKGRLIVLGGFGYSSSEPSNLPVGGGYAYPGASRNNFANNEGWHDDVADGPVSAVITFPGQEPIDLSNTDESNDAWIIIGPPDYSPYTPGITTLYDIAFQAAVENKIFEIPETPSFQEHVLPILQAASNLRWVSDLEIWSKISRDYKTLSKLDDQDAKNLRITTYQDLMEVEGNALLANFKYTAVQKNILENWSKENFISDFNPISRETEISPNGLDKASLDQGMGGGFYPGIEAGILATYPTIYSATTAFRFKQKPFDNNGVTQTLDAGFFTRNMACPWQADFLKCATEPPISHWWPAQRPINIQVKVNGSFQKKDWIDENFSHKDLVEKHSMLGFIISEKQADGTDVLFEVERDVNLPHRDENSPND